MIWFRYIDVILFIWTAGEKELDEFLNHLNSFHSNLRCTHECSRESLNFPDIIVKIQRDTVFTPAPFIFFCFARTLRTHLVRTKVYPAEERLVGSRKCLRNRCQVCKNVVEADPFQSFVDKKVYKMNHRFTCLDKCLVYLGR